jgi:hypothetical protein
VVAWALYHLGGLDRLEGDLATARARLRESLARFDALFGPGSLPGVFVQGGLGGLALAEGRPDEARAAFTDVLRQWEGALHPPIARPQLCLFGILAAAEGQLGRAVRLLAAGSVATGHPGSLAAPDARVEGEDALARARAALGEAAFQAAWAEGQAMSLEQAIACALDEAADA